MTTIFRFRMCVRYVADNGGYMHETPKLDPEAIPLTIEQRQAREIEQLRDDLMRAYRRMDELRVERLTIANVIQRGQYDEQLQIIETNTTPKGVVVIVC